MEKIRTEIRDIIVCPYCHSALALLASSFDCTKCKKTFPIQNGIPNFLDFDVENTPDSQFQADQMFERTLTARIHNFGKRIINSEYRPVNHVADFVKGIGPGHIIVELGSGSRQLRDDVINVDLFPFPNVDLLANVAKTPFREDALDFIILDAVLEHVAEPHVVVAEVNRILKPRGQVICVVPWVFPYHGYPKNYFNISRDGLDFLFKDFSECRIEMEMGPTSALTNLVSEYIAVALSGRRKITYSFFKGLVLLPIFLLKFLDKFWSRSGKATRIASSLCVLAKK
jgi:uncharacterized protein YbaR (Trm112 family)